jgi:hypothetical protein
MGCVLAAGGAAERCVTAGDVPLPEGAAAVVVGTAVAFAAAGEDAEAGPLAPLSLDAEAGPLAPPPLDAAAIPPITASTMTTTAAANQPAPWRRGPRRYRRRPDCSINSRITFSGSQIGRNSSLSRKNTQDSSRPRSLPPDI